MSRRVLLEFSRFRSSEKNIWDEFVPKTNNGTLFHLRSFLNYHPKSRFNDHSLIIKKKGNLFSVFPAVEQIIDNEKILVSHPGATVGSFAVPENLSIADSLSLVEKLVHYAKDKKFQGVRINLPPSLYQRRISNYIEYSFFKLGFKYTKREVTSILFLEDSIDKTKFKKPLFPGNLLTIYVEKKTERSSLWKFVGRAKVNDELICVSEFSAMIGLKDGIDK